MLQAQPTSATTQPISARTRSHRNRHRTVADLDKRSRAGKRAAQLMAQFEAELGGSLTEAQRLAVSRAAVMVAIAEDARVRMLNGIAPDITYNDIVRLDRSAAEAVAALGIGVRGLRSRRPRATSNWLQAGAK